MSKVELLVVSFLEIPIIIIIILLNIKFGITDSKKFLKNK